MRRIHVRKRILETKIEFMGIMTVTMSTIRIAVDRPLPPCDCGGKLLAVAHYKKRKPKELVCTVATCDNPACPFHDEGYLDYTFEDLERKIKKFQSK